MQQLRRSLALVLCMLALVPLARAQESPEAFPQNLLEVERLSDSVASVHSGRSWLEKRGLKLEAVYTGEYFANLRGGVSTNNAREYRGLLDLTLDVDSELLGLYRGGVLRVHVQSGHGRGVSPDHAGVFQCVSNIEADDLAQVSAINYRHTLGDGAFWVQVGKQDVNDEFAASAHALVLVHSSAGLPINIPMPTYPDQGWGALAALSPWKPLVLKAGVFQGEPDGGRSLGREFARLRGPFAISEVKLTYSVLGVEGSLTAGGWHSADRFEVLNGSDAGRLRRGSYGGYAILDQTLWTNAQDPTRYLALFGQYSWARPDRSEATHYLGGGLVWHGPLDARTSDIVGVAAYHAVFSERPGPNPSETALEFFYSAQLTPWLALVPDAQLIHHPGGTQNHTAFALGIRFVLKL